MIAVRKISPAVAGLQMSDEMADCLRQAVIAALKEAIATKAADPNGLIPLFVAVTHAFAQAPQPHSPVVVWADPQAIIEAVRRRVRRNGGVAKGYDLDLASLALKYGAQG